MVILSFAAAQAKEMLPFSPGEKFFYAIKKIGIKVGEATLEFHGQTELKGKKVYLMIFTASAVKFYDQERIYIDPESFYPLMIERNLNIWGKKENIREEYSQQTGEVRIVKKAGGKTSEQVIKKQGPIDNIYCFIYRYRTLGKFTLGDAVTVHLPTRDVRLSLAEIQKLKLEGQVYETYYFKSDPAQYKMWLDKGENKIPLRINGAVGIADTSLVMIKYQAK